MFVGSVESVQGGSIPLVQGAILPGEQLYLSIEEEIRWTMHAWRGAEMPTQSTVSVQVVDAMARESKYAWQETAVHNLQELARLTKKQGQHLVGWRRPLVIWILGWSPWTLLRNSHKNSMRSRNSARRQPCSQLQCWNSWCIRQRCAGRKRWHSTRHNLEKTKDTHCVSGRSVQNKSASTQVGECYTPIGSSGVGCTEGRGPNSVKAATSCVGPNPQHVSGCCNDKISPGCRAKEAAG